MFSLVVRHRAPNCSWPSDGCRELASAPTYPRFRGICHRSMLSPVLSHGSEDVCLLSVRPKRVVVACKLHGESHSKAHGSLPRRCLHLWLRLDLIDPHTENWQYFLRYDARGHPGPQIAPGFQFKVRSSSAMHIASPTDAHRPRS